MNTWLGVLKQTPLFAGMTDEEIHTLQQLMGVRMQSYQKGEFVFFAGDHMESIGIVLSGSAHIIQEDYWGNRNILAHLAPTQMFGEAFACQPDREATVSVIAIEPTKILFFCILSLSSVDSSMGPLQMRVWKNLVTLLAQKNEILTKKIRYLSQRSLRKKLMFYLSDEAMRQHSTSFSLPFNRQELADYLSVDRSALSSELSKMQKEGLLSYHKEAFTLHKIWDT